MSKTTTEPTRVPAGDEAAQLGRRVLVLAPFGRDAAEIGRVLTGARLDARRCTDASELCREIRRGAAAALVAEEVLGDEARALLAATLAEQPAWSDFPLLVMISRGRKSSDQWQAVRGIEGTGYLSLLERPLHVATLLSAVRTASRARERQYQVRRELAARQRAEASLRTLTETLEERVEQRTRQVRELASRITMTEQAERRRIAQVLHDDLQQQLYGLGMVLDLAEQATAPEERQRLHVRARNVQKKAVETARTLSTDLSPPILEGENMEHTLDWLAMREEKQHDLHVEVEMESACRIPLMDMRILLYQILRELLFNVVKHAGTGRARLRAWQEGEQVFVCVEDEGAGFDPTELEEEADEQGGFGLRSVRERLQLVGGHLEIDSSPGAGTRTTVAVPTAEAGSSE